jgi:hypothetical protein
MGYDLHITRALDWASNVGCEIPEDEWLALVADDRELVADPGHGACAVRYRAAAWFDWFEGNVFTSDPDRQTVTKMLALASRLDGIVQGDDGEIYETARQWPRRSGPPD